MSYQLVPHAISKLAERWRDEAALLRERYADERTARVCQAHADELLAAASDALAEEVGLREAIALSGYSESGLRKLIVAGELDNVGRKGAPRLKRSQLPRKSPPVRKAKHHRAMPGEPEKLKRFDPSAAARLALRGVDA